MEISLDKREDSYGLVKIQLKQADYQPELDTQLKEYRKKANLKGFRPGKVPMGMIKKMVGKDLKADVVSRVAIDQLNDYIEAEGLNPIFSPLPKDEPLTLEDFEAKDDFDFEFELCLEPEITYSLSKDLAISAHKIEPTDADLEETVEKMMTDMPQTVQADTVEEGDFIKGTFQQAASEFEMETVLPLNQVPEDKRSIFIGKGKDEAFTFDLREALPEDKEIKLLFGIEEEKAAEMKGEMELTITEITRSQQPEMNQEFFDRVLGPEVASTEEEFRTELKKKMAEVNQSVADSIFTSAIRDRLIGEIAVNLPEDLLKKVLKLSQEKEALSDEEVEKRFPNFLTAVKWRAISNRIFKDAELTIENEEVELAARDVVRQQLQQMGLVGMPDEQMESFVDMMLQREDSRKQNMEAAYEQVFTTKISNYIKEQITITEEIVSIEEFKNIVDELNKKAEEEAKALEEAEGATAEVIEED
ncbi:MAG: trigger factor [Flammeovirgaceae bacterium]